MSRLLKVLIIVLIVFCLAVISLFIWINSYIRSPRVVDSLRETAATHLKADIHFSTIKANILNGFSLHHVFVSKSQNEPSEDVLGTKLEIDKLKVRYALLPFFLRTIKLNTVELLRPNLTIIQQDDGSWDMPNLDPSLKLISTPSVQLFGQRFATALDHFKLRHGDLVARHRDNWTIIEIKGADIRGRFHQLPEDSRPLGTLHLDELNLANTLSLQYLRAPIHAEHGKMRLPEWRALSHGGTAKGNAILDFSAQPALYDVSLNLIDIDLSRMMTTFGGASSFLYGRLNLQMELKGNLQQISAALGTGTLEIHQANFSQLGGLQLLSRLLNLEELTNTTYEIVKGSFKIEEQKLTFYDIQAPNKNIQLTGSGYISFDNQINFEIRLAIAPELAEQIPDEFISNFKYRPDGYRTILFTLSGDLQNPKTNLDEKLSIDSSLLNPEPEEPLDTTSLPVESISTSQTAP